MPKTNFVDGDKSLGIPGTRVLAAFLNKIFTHRHDGLDQDGSAPLDYAVDSGAVNAYVGTFTPAFTAYISGLPVRVKIANANTITNPTLKFDALPVKTLKRNVGALLPGDLRAGGIYTIVYEAVGDCFVVLNPSLSGPNEVTSIFGARVSKSLATIYEAATDGIVELYVDGADQTGAAIYYRGFVGSSSPPTTKRAGCFYQNKEASFSMHVSKGEFYKATETVEITDPVTVTLTFTPIGS